MENLIENWELHKKGLLQLFLVIINSIKSPTRVNKSIMSTMNNLP